MNKKIVFVFVILLILILAACGGSESTKGSGNSYSLKEEIKFETEPSNSIHIDKAGQVVLFGEDVEGKQNTYTMKVYVDGDVQTLEGEGFNMHSNLTHSGKVTSYQSDIEAGTDGGNLYTYKFYDPISDESKDYVIDKDEYLTFTYKSFMVEDSNGEVVEGIKTNHVKDGKDAVEVLSIDLESDTMETIDLTTELEGYYGDSFYDTNVHYSFDGQKLFILARVNTNEDYDGPASENTVFIYDRETKEVEKVLEQDDSIYFLDQDYISSADGKYLYFVKHIQVEDDSVLGVRNRSELYALDIETKEVKELGQGDSPSAIDENRIFYIDNKKGEFYIQDVDNGESNLIYTDEDFDAETMRIVTASISYDGSTFAYILEYKGDGEEVIRIVKSK
ncbi:TolB family protein [Paraliobacillus sediminis]|uniref:TolB family protein n=1 Tax=Paraliobacillus sediminis TaxID=1885916 RepID=UPI000E3C70D2|nr:hypothetical protein [Paraliobacillus sediminis]